MLSSSTHPVCGILYIDDEEKALKYFRMAFGQKYRVFTAASGAEGLDLLRREAANIGIVISDQRMPGMLGAEVLGAVRQEFPQVVRLLTTAYSDLDSAIQAVNQGHIYQYVVKPWEIPELGMVLQRAADYFLVLAERNELLALKMEVLQRLVCGDRLKSFLLAAREWPEPRRAALQKALAALVAALPSSREASSATSRDFSRRDFAIETLLQDGFVSASRVLDALGEEGISPAETLAAALGGTVTEAGSEGWTIEVAADQDVFTWCGVVVEREPSAAAVAVLRALVQLAATGGRLRLMRNGVLIADLNPPEVAPPAGEILEALGRKYAEWDIHSR